MTKIIQKTKKEMPKILQIIAQKKALTEELKARAFEKTNKNTDQ